MFNLVLLFEGDPCQLTEQYPKGAEIDEISLITALCIPQTLKTKDEEVFVFNTNDSYCFAWAFTYKRIPASIVVVSSTFRPAIFFDFFKSLQETFQTTPESDPLCRFGLAKSLMISWHSNCQNEIVINYPFKKHIIDFSTITSWTSNFSVIPISPYIDEIWNSIISNNGVMLIAPSAEIASISAIATLSLFEPLKYEEPYLLYTQSNDPRYQEILNGETKYKFIATTDPELAEHCKGFNTICQLAMNQTIPNQTKPSAKLREEYSRKTYRLLCILTQYVYCALLFNPYFNILNRKIDGNEFKKYFGEFPKKLFENLQNTQTYQKWRHGRIDIDEVRWAFLSCQPQDAVSQVKQDELIVAYNELSAIEHMCKRDAHLRAVVQSNLRLLKKRIKKEMRNRE
ncbi:hypothetical protein GPJ56_010859 [Histomonas meleagridis]|uniref:uncharacterized protein n=1 Tax=Histomonas meleagridis TaxID=135588 RepID=UPI0035594AC5|nr:hypothetical protein GPJ56_010859 [Histomonas meleagridis]KAH0803719.1 hypothetical protein GO595_003493 [Histomonas meleagridis]